MRLMCRGWQFTSGTPGCDGCTLAWTVHLIRVLKPVMATKRAKTHLSTGTRPNSTGAQPKLGSWTFKTNLQGQSKKANATFDCLDVAKRAEDLFEANRTATSAVTSRTQNNDGRCLIQVQEVVGAYRRDPCLVLETTTSAEQPQISCCCCLAFDSVLPLSLALIALINNIRPTNIRSFLGQHTQHTQQPDQHWPLTLQVAIDLQKSSTHGASIQEVCGSMCAAVQVAAMPGECQQQRGRQPVRRTPSSAGRLE